MEELKYEIKGQLKDFPKVFSKLMRASFSIYNCVFASTEYAHYYPEEIEAEGKTLEDICTEDFVATGLAKNVLNDRLSGNEVNWDECAVSISAFGVGYMTRGGLTFGWDSSPDYCGTDEVDYTLSVYCYAREGGTLEKSLIENGFSLEK